MSWPSPSPRHAARRVVPGRFVPSGPGNHVLGWRTTRITNDADKREQRTEEQILVRRATDVQASWTERERGMPGAFTIQLVLDGGATEYVLRPAAEDVEPLRLLGLSKGAVFDAERKVLIFDDVEF
jgi:hypothetical protein